MSLSQKAPVRVRFASMVVVLLGLSAGAWADVVTTAGGESLQGMVTFREGNALEITSESGEKVRIALADLASLDLKGAAQQWIIGGTGDLTTNGSFFTARNLLLEERSRKPVFEGSIPSSASSFF